MRLAVMNCLRCLLAAAMVLPITAMLATEAAGACADLTSCDSCSNTKTCHWCPDNECHTIGSIHGCFYGTHCYDNSQCQRKHPEYRGYAAPSIGVLLGVFLVGGTAFVCGVAAISTAREYAKESAASRENAASARSNRSSSSAVRSRDGEYMMLVGNDNNVLAEDPSAEQAVAEGAKGVRQVEGRSRRVCRGRHGLPGLEPSGPSPLARKVVRYTQIICGTGMAAILVMCSLVVTFAPHTPGVNMCNTQFDWGSIVHSITKASVEADFQILVSIYNPNVMDAKIESGTAVLYHKHSEVGTMAFEPAVLAGGYVTDLLLSIAFDAETWEEARIGMEYETGQLTFLMDATVSASVMWHGLKTYPFTFSVHNYYIKVADTTSYDRSLCKCAHMMQGNSRQTLSLEQSEDEGGRLVGAAAEDDVLLPTAMAGNRRAELK